MISLRFPYDSFMCQVRVAGYDMAMASWMLSCVKCESLFLHSPIADKHLSDYFFPEKPEFPVDGSELKCPSCGHAALYKRTDLIYRA